MKKTINSLFFLTALIVLVTSCQKQNKKLILGEGGFSSSTAFTSSTPSPILADTIKASIAATFSWGSVTYSNPVVVTYSLQFDIASDTAGGEWTKAKTIIIGSKINSYAIAVQDLNTAAIGVGMAANTQGTLLARIKADVNQANGSMSTVPSVYSNVLALTITPYSLILYVPNSAQFPTKWDPATAPILNVVPDSSGKYEGYVYLGGSTAGQSFKYTNAPDFAHINYGDSTGNLLTTNGLASAMSVPTGGYYEVTANFQTAPGTWSATRTTWGVIGDATPNGWTTDNEMTYDSVSQVWFIDSLSFSTTGSFKFRANNAWVIDFGIAKTSNPVTVGAVTTGMLTYADNPFFAYNSTLNNLTVTTNGVYKVVLDLHISGSYTYTLTKL
jgi:hypothetical protein